MGGWVCINRYIRYEEAMITIGNDSVPKIIINDTVNFFLKLQSPFR